MSVTSTQINACTDSELLFVSCATAAGDFTPPSGHWGDPIIATPWQYWRELLRWFIENEYFPEWPYRVCGLDIESETFAAEIEALLTIAADRLGSSLSLTRGDETTVEWARRCLCAKLAAEQA